MRRRRRFQLRASTTVARSRCDRSEAQCAEFAARARTLPDRARSARASWRRGRRRRFRLRLRSGGRGRGSSSRRGRWRRRRTDIAGRPDRRRRGTRTRSAAAAPAPAAARARCGAAASCSSTRTSPPLAARARSAQRVEHARCVEQARFQLAAVDAQPAARAHAMSYGGQRRPRLRGRSIALRGRSSTRRIAWCSMPASMKRSPYGRKPWRA